MLIIAERINASRKQIAQAISAGDRAFIQGEAKAQTQAGAHYIDVNAGTFVGEEADKLKWIVEAVQEVTDLPLSIDSPDAEVIEAVMPLLKKTPLINSITLEPSRIEGVLPIVVAHKTKVIALCQSGRPRRLSVRWRWRDKWWKSSRGQASPSATSTSTRWFFLSRPIRNRPTRP
jgi:cobalamin-dependent methionine synthase I